MPFAGLTRSWRAVLAAAALFAFAWLFRFNDPGGSFAGLTDDHFFYLVRGWQILFGDLPVRDFVDHGAPLYYYLGAAVQLIFGRGTLSELAFSVTVLAAGAAATFWLAMRASGSVAAGVIAGLFHVLLAPRFYNYPKIIVYAAAVPAMWWYANRRGWAPRLTLAAVTVVGFLFRHDHGVFVAAGVVALLATLRAVPWRTRVRELLLYGALVAAVLAPYLVFIEINRGVAAYFRDATDWAAKDRERAPVVWPGLFDNPDGVSEAARSGALPARAIAVVRDNLVAWVFYTELALPVVALLLLAAAPDAFRPGWPQARAKLAAVAVIGIALNAGFLRSPLAARLADPSVPHAILLAWLLWAVVRLVRPDAAVRARLPYAPMRLAAAALPLPLFFTVGVAMTTDLYDRLDASSLAGRPGRALERSAFIADTLREEWRIQTWVARDERPDLVTLALYLYTCTGPEDRIFVQPYIPQVLALARRPFAAGHADLRPGFFDTEDAESLALERLRRQSVPVALLETGDALENFRKAYPRITAYLDEQYRVAGTHVFDGRFGITLLIRRDLPLASQYSALDWPCPAVR